MPQPEHRPYLTAENTICATCGQPVKDPLFAKCEYCGREAPSKPFPEGWQQRGMSRHGTTYQRKGVAWWCPGCIQHSVGKG